MDLVTHILKKAGSGSPVQMMSDTNGNRWAVVGGRFMSPRTTEFDLTREQYAVLRYALRRPRRARLFSRYRLR